MVIVEVASYTNPMPSIHAHGTASSKGAAQRMSSHAQPEAHYSNCMKMNGVSPM